MENDNCKDLLEEYCKHEGDEVPIAPDVVLSNVDINATTCIVSWCGNKCALYQKDMSGKRNYVLISSLESNGYCPYRPSIFYVF